VPIGDPAGGGRTNGSRQSAVPPGSIGEHSAHDTPGSPPPAHGDQTGWARRCHVLSIGSTVNAAQMACVRGTQPPPPASRLSVMPA
jgi:hypothetical protein